MTARSGRRPRRGRRPVVRYDQGRPVVTMTVRNGSSHDCAVSSYGPPISIFDSSGALVGTGYDTTLVLIAPSTQVVRPGHAVRASVEWSYGCVASAPGPLRLAASFGPSGTRIATRC